MIKRDPTWLSEWNPEDENFWKSKGKAIAKRNLIWSIVAEHLGFSIWLIWSIVATKLPQAGFHYTTDQLFQLVPGSVIHGFRKSLRRVEIYECIRNNGQLAMALRQVEVVH